MFDRIELWLRHFSVRQRMLAIIALLLLPMAILSAVSMAVLDEQEVSFHDSVEESVHALIPLTTLEYYLQQALVDELLAESSDKVPDFAQLTRSVDNSFSRIRVGNRDAAVPGKVIDDAEHAWEQARPSVRRLIEQVHARHAKLPIGVDARQELERAIADITRARVHLSKVLRERYREAVSQRTRQLHWIMWSWVMTLAAAALLVMLFLRSLLRPVAELADVARRVEDGGHGLRVPVHGRDELAMLGHCFNRMHAHWDATRINLQTEASRDPLTGAYNRRGILACLQSEMEKHRVHKVPLSIFAIDLDRFKMINDHYGHSTGDRALQWITRTLKGMLRDDDYLGRYGGDEFIAILPGTAQDNATEIARRIHDAVQEAARREDVYPGLSIGVATAPVDGDTIEALIEVADSRLYAQKKHRDA